MAFEKDEDGGGQYENGLMRLEELTKLGYSKVKLKKLQFERLDRTWSGKYKQG